MSPPQTTSRTFILAGGLGTRLAHLTKDLPKPMASVGGRPFLEWQIESFRAQGFRDFVLLVGHRKEAIVDHFGDGSGFGVTIEYSVEEELLGTGGAFLQALERFPCETFVLANGDTYFPVPLGSLLARSRSEPGSVWLAAKLVRKPDRYGTIAVDDRGEILSFREKNPRLDEGFINGGVYCGVSSVFEGRAVLRCSMETDLFPRLLSERRLRCLAFGEPFIDIGVPRDFQLAQTLIPRWHAQEKKRALFVDRDGVVIEDTGYLSRPEDVHLIPGCLELLRKARALGYLLIVVTNQAGVAKGKMTSEDVDRVNGRMQAELAKLGVALDDIFVCPYHPDGTVPEYAASSLDRKPSPGMVLKAAEKWGLDLEKSIMVGDKDSDVIVNTVLRSKTIPGRYKLKKIAAISTFDEISQLLEST
jgi:D,D-heptose 1,7-bisphosphate phosphatase